MLATNKRILQHVFNVLDRAGFSYVNHTLNENWSLLWAHEYPFNKKNAYMFKNKKAYQKVNKIPGMSILTKKLSLVNSGMSYIPKAFNIPEELPELKEYSKKHTQIMFVHKNAGHRGIEIKTPEEIVARTDTDKKSFAQVYITNPLLIDGYKFDIGVYVIVSSISPLRVYIYEDDAQFRFCQKKYFPFDKNDVHKYVIGASFRPIWKVPSLVKLYKKFDFTKRGAFDSHLRSLGKDPNRIWDKIYHIIQETFLKHANKLAEIMKEYRDPNSFFELVRFDFILNSSLNVYLMEVNMSPNLSSSHYPEQATMYEQVIYNALRLVNVARGGIISDSLQVRSEEERRMQVSERDIAVSLRTCSSTQCNKVHDSCKKAQCQLCKECLSSTELTSFHLAYLEYYNRHACKRLIPKPFNTRNEAEAAKSNTTYYVNLSQVNYKMHHWFLEKCLQNKKWCD